jgi:hypothetical protein
VNAALGKRGIQAKRDLIEGSMASPHEAVADDEKGVPWKIKRVAMY